MLLIELLQEKYPAIEITVAVRNSPIINDATLTDAGEIGLTEIVRVISSGCDTAGTLLKDCTTEFRDLFYSADMVIGKGQGNFETLNESDRDIFFLLRPKCTVLARHLDRPLGCQVLVRSNRLPRDSAGGKEERRKAV